MLKHWWKILTGILVLFTVFISLKTPLAPGLVNLDKGRLTSEIPFELNLEGYATSFLTEENDLSAWFTPSLNPNKEMVCLSVEPISATHLKLTGVLPEVWSNQSLDLYVKSNLHGSMALFNAAYLVPPTENEIFGQKVAFCDPGSATTTPAFFNFSFKTILYETIRNLNFHVPMFFAMMFLMTISLIFSIKYLGSGNATMDLKASEAVNIALFFGLLGLATGSLWARFTWGAWWVNDTKLNGSAISVLIYLAYIILRNSVNDKEKQGRLAAVYNIFAYVLMMVFIMVLPRLTDSLHPGNGGNPAFSNYDLDNNLRMVFYPAVLGWILLSYWIFSLKYRLSAVKEKLEHEIDE
jgi:heme exporter protein C